MKTEIYNKIRELVEYNIADIDLCYEVYDIISTCNLKEQPEIFRCFSIIFKELSTGVENKTSYFSDSEVECMKNKLKNTVDNYLQFLVLKSRRGYISQDEFDVEIWNYIESFDNIRERIFVMFNYCRDKRHPYFNISEYQRQYIMSDEELKKARMDNGLEHSAKVKYILGSGEFDQYTEKAYALVKIMEEKEEVGKVLTMVDILKYFDLQMHMLVSLLEE